MSGATAWQSFSPHRYPAACADIALRVLWIALLVFRELTLAVDAFGLPTNITFRSWFWSLWLWRRARAGSALAIVMLLIMAPRSRHC